MQGPYAALPSQTFGQEIFVSPELEQLSLKEKIESLLQNHPVLIFIKGTAQNPQCGFSANSVRLLNSFQIPYKTFDILKSSDIRQGLKDYSQWPTYPQLYVRGELIGGNDVIQEMYDQGELKSLVLMTKNSQENQTQLPT
jgi:monothiol glutaredoxin